MNVQVPIGESAGHGPHALFDAAWYLQQNPELTKVSIDPLQHYMTQGWREGRDPHPLFDTSFYLEQNRDVAAAGENPLVHFCLFGWREGRDPLPLFDTSFYLEQNKDVAAAGENPLMHYLAYGWKEGRDPHPKFDTSWYLDNNQDIAVAGIEPLSHYVHFGLAEGRSSHPTIQIRNTIGSTDQVSIENHENISTAQPPASLLTYYHTKFSNRGEGYEEFDPNILNGRIPEVKLLAFYLPQFHVNPENDHFWGKGFTEWRQIPRGLPRFPGHYQPRIPRDLGYYDLTNVDVIAQQTQIAKASGIYGFGIYYYWFNGRRVLHKPLELFLEAAHISMPFFIIWANENWTKTWDGMKSEVLLHQDYRLDDEPALLADLARHFRDGRYIKIAGRPLFVIYKLSDLPDAKETFARWRRIWQLDHNVNPLIFIAQTFGCYDPVAYGLDGALEFPPHKLADEFRGRPTPAFDPQFSGRVISYDDFVYASMSEITADYPLIKTIVPSWDNDPRRPMRGLTLEGSSPQKYENWLRSLVQKTANTLVFGERFIAINAWNEWAEGAYLEPDVHYGAAYLNATARAVCPDLTNSSVSRPIAPTIAISETQEHRTKFNNRISVIIPNYNHERYLERRIASIVSQSRQPDQIVFLDDDSSDESLSIAEKLLSGISIPYLIVKNERNSGNVFRQWVKGLELATGNLIWIAESDDDARADFLTWMEKCFERQDVLISYGRIRYIDANGTPNSGLDTYYDDLTEMDWSRSQIIPAFKAMNADFAIKNIIPNASGAVFRKPLLTDSERARLCSYSFAGDWYFYALISRGGSIAYCHETETYFRTHSSSVSQKTLFGERHIHEHKMLLDDLTSLYAINLSLVQTHIETLSKTIGVDASMKADLRMKVSPCQSTRKDKYRICIAAHSFNIGGGEILPIDLANAFRAQGHHVTYITLEPLPTSSSQPGQIRHRLRNDIPVFSFNDVANNFQRFLADYGIEILNSHNVGVEYHLFKMNIPISIPYLASLHGGYETVPELLTPAFIRYIEENVDVWLYLSEKNIAPLTRREVNRPTFVRVHNAVSSKPLKGDSKRFLRARYQIPIDAFVLVLASRAIRQKGWQTAIDTTEEIIRAKTGRNCLLLLLGDGPDLTELRQQNSAKEYVRFFGYVDNPQELISLSDLGIFPSTFTGETSPLFILECFQNGIPVVATDVGEIRNMIEALKDLPAGKVLPLQSDHHRMVDAMATTITEVITNQSLLSQWERGAFSASLRFSFDDLFKTYLEQISNLRKKNDAVS